MKSTLQNRCLLVISATVVVMLAALANCNSRSPRNFTTMDLIIPAEKMPESLEPASEASPMGYEIGFGDADDSYISFKPLTSKYNVARHYVLQFKNIEKAVAWYERESLSEFNDNSIAVDEPWRTPPELSSFASQSAGRYRVACTINNVAGREQICKLMAQYEEFVVIFSSVIAEDTMNLNQFKDVINEIDQIMVTYLGK